MKVVHLTNNLNDGAGKAAYRLHKALLKQGAVSLMLVFKKDCSDNTVIELSEAHTTHSEIKSNRDALRKAISFIHLMLRQFYWKLKSYRWKPLVLFNLNIPFVSFRNVRRYLENVDIICLYSVQGFLSSSLIRKIYDTYKVPIVWTPLDIEPLTGGCHFNNGCMRFTQSCGNCPQLANRKEGDISRRIFNQKMKELKNIPITFVAGSSWAHSCIEKSSLFGSKRAKRIYLCVDRDIFTKVDKDVARKVLKLPDEKKIILFGAFSLNDKRKGGEYLLSALKKLHEKLASLNRNLSDSVVLLTMGRDDGFRADDISFQRVHLGQVQDDRILSLAYQASDVLASPSIDDFGPMIINEALMCGTPIVAFNVGVAPDLIKLKKTGYLAKNYSADEFSEGLFQALFEDKNDYADAYREIGEGCSPSNQAKEYISLFEELLSKNE